MTKTLSISLTTDITYVSGKVNNKDYTFTLLETSNNSSIWIADVDRATPDIYVCEIITIDNRGNTTSFSTTLYYGLQLITDRTESDVATVKELTSRGFANWTEQEISEFLAGLKGAYNTTDLNRVESAVAYLYERFKSNGYDYPVPAIKNTWQITEYIDSEQAERYLLNIKQLRARIAVPEGTPEVVDTLENLTYEEANNLEKILEILDQCITLIEQSFFYSSELYGGEI